MSGYGGRRFPRMRQCGKTSCQRQPLSIVQRLGGPAATICAAFWDGPLISARNCLVDECRLRTDIPLRWSAHTLPGRNCQRLVQTVEGLSSIVIDLTSSATRTPQRLAQSSLNSLKARRIRRRPIGAHLWNCPCTRKNRRHGPRTLHSNTERPRRSSLG
jgi:hypothetical protein